MVFPNLLIYLAAGHTQTFSLMVAPQHMQQQGSTQSFALPDLTTTSAQTTPHTALSLDLYQSLPSELCCIQNYMLATSV